jgi:hypothetical protein
MKDFLKIIGALAVLVGITVLVLVVSGVFSGESEKPLLLKQKRLRAVLVDDGPEGHITFGIDEASLDEVEGITNVRFSLLRAWQFDNNTKIPHTAPEKIRALDNSTVCMVGFMFPAETDAAVSVRNFFLVPSTQTCCYGPAPDYNRFVIVTLPKEIPFVRFKPLVVTGKLHLERNLKKEGYLYHMEGDEVAIAIDEEPPCTVDYTDLENKGYIRFDFSLLEQIDLDCDSIYDKNGAIIMPENLKPLHCKKVVVQGYYLGRYLLPCSKIGQKLLLGKYRVREEGGRLTTYLNAVIVRFRSDQKLPKIWVSEAVITGTLHVHRHPRSWPESGVISIDEAIVGAPE